MNRRSFLWSLLLATGCASTRIGQSAPSQLPKLRFAVADAKTSADLQADYEAFRVALAAALATEIEFFPLVNQVAAAIALQQAKVDLVLTGPSEYVIARSRTKAVPVISITRPNYHSIIAVANSAIQSVTELRGKTIAMSDVGSTSGHLGPTKMLIDAGVNPQTDLTIRMLGDEGSVAALERGEVDAWAGSTSDYQKSLQERFPMLAKSPILPGDVIVASSNLDPAVVETIQNQMLKHQTKLSQALATQKSKYRDSTFLLVQDADYDPIREAYQAIGQGNFIIHD
jgi:phosphonate transport system substrate-binding protein